MFERDFLVAFNKYINQKKENANLTYAETTDWQEYRVKPVLTPPQPFIVAGDDKFKTKKWDHLLKDCSFYFDIPTL